MHNPVPLLLAFLLPAVILVSMPATPMNNPEGVWHFLNDPLAQHHNGRTILGCVDRAGSPKIVAYDHATGTWTESVLRPNWKVDDHISPTLVVREQDQRILAFYARGSDVFYHISERPLDASAFGPARALPAQDGNFPRPLQIREGDRTRLFLLYRDILPQGNGNKRPALRTSGDGGESWSEAHALVDFGNWMYPKTTVGSDGSIHLLLTSNPTHMQVNNLHYVRYHLGSFFKADGTHVADIEDLPLAFDQLDLVYASPGTDNAPPVRASDLAIDPQGRPVIAAVRYDGTDRRDHTYTRFKFNGLRWDAEDFAKSAPLSDNPKLGWVYFGGAALDHANPDRIYYSAKTNGTFELFLAERPAGQNTWNHHPVTQNSTAHQIRPWSVPATPDSPQRLIWLEGHLERFNDYRTHLKIQDAPSL